MANAKLSSMAWRNIWRNRRRTFLTLFGIAFGVMLAVIFTGIGDASYGSMIDKAALMGSGHVTVQHPGYQELPSAKKTVLRTESLVERARAVPEVAASTVRINGAVMLATATESAGASFMGVDPETETPQTLQLIDSITEGAFFESPNDEGIILGKKLASNLGIGLGKRVVYTLTDKSGEIVSGLGKVTGIIESGSDAMDAGLCLLPLAKARTVLGYEADEATVVAVFLNDNRASDDVAAVLRRQSNTDVAVLTWKETQPDLHGFIQMKVGSTLVFEVIIMLLVGAGIFNSLFVSVMERLREFGVMLAIGFSPGHIFRLVMWESLFIGITGLVGSFLVAAGPYYHLATNGIDTRAMVKDGMEVSGIGIDPIIHAQIYPENALAIAAVVLLATLTAGLYPAWKAGRVPPVDAIKLV